MSQLRRTTTTPRELARDRIALQMMKGHEDDGMFFGNDEALPDTRSGAFVTILRKEVIQPQVPLRLPCYDFTPVADPTVVGCLLLRG